MKRPSLVVAFLSLICVMAATVAIIAIPCCLMWAIWSGDPAAWKIMGSAFVVLGTVIGIDKVLSWLDCWPYTASPPSPGSLSGQSLTSLKPFDSPFHPDQWGPETGPQHLPLWGDTESTRDLTT